MQKATALSIPLLPAIAIDKSGDATRILRSGLFFGIIPIVALFTWGFLTPISGAIIANGILKIDTNSKIIQHLEGGIVKAILVKEGSKVVKNQPLLKLEDIEINSKLNILNDKYKAAKAKEARFQAQQKLQKNINFPIELAKSKDQKTQQIIANEIQLFQSKRKSLNDKVRLLTVQISQTEKQISSLQNESHAIDKSMGFINKQLDANLELSSQGFAGKNQVWESQRNLSEKKERFNAQQANIEAARVNITSFRTQINSLENEYKQEGDDQLKETKKELSEIEESLRPIREQNDRAIVVSPVDGQVINLQVNTIGGVIGSGQNLMEVVPIVDHLLVEVKISTLDIDSVQVDQEADVQLLSYNRLKTPLLKGKIVYISGDVLENPIKPGEYYYLSHIQVNQASLKELPETVKLFPGMPIAAFIKTRQRTFIAYILEPILDRMPRHQYRKGITIFDMNPTHGDRK